MRPLVKIQTIPIKLEMKTTKARLEPKSGGAQIEMTRSNNSLTVKSKPIKLKMDTVGLSKEVRRPADDRARRPGGDKAAYSVKSGYDANIRSVDNGRMTLEIHLNKPSGQDVAPPESVEGQYTEYAAPGYSNDSFGDFSIEFGMNEAGDDMTGNLEELTFIPGRIEISIAEYPKIIFEYTGGPLYVPPSANPYYKLAEMMHKYL